MRDREPLNRQAQMEEFMFLGLRLRKGVSAEAFRERFGISLEEAYGQVIERYCRMGLMGEEEGRVFLTLDGISVSNRILSDFLL